MKSDSRTFLQGLLDRSEFLFACAPIVLAAALGMVPAAHAGDRDDDHDRHGAKDFRITTLSSAPHLVSGGSALVRIDVPRSVSLSRVRVELNDRNVTSAFRVNAGARTLTGLVNNLKDGKNRLEVYSSGGPAERLTLTNYPITGPIISGPHQTPFYCQTATFLLPDGNTLGAPLDDDCTVAPVVTYMYLRTGTAALTPLPDTTQLPADVATTTTLSNATVPFVVRVETRTVNRGIYQSAVLHDPTTEGAPTPFAAPKGWNRRLIAIEGFGCPGGLVHPGRGAGQPRPRRLRFHAAQPRAPRRGLRDVRQHAAARIEQLQRGARQRSDDDVQGAVHQDLRRTDVQRQRGLLGRRVRELDAGRPDSRALRRDPDPVHVPRPAEHRALGLRRTPADALLGGDRSGRVHRQPEERSYRLQERAGVHRRGQPVRADGPGAGAGGHSGLRVGALQRDRAGLGCATTR